MRIVVLLEMADGAPRKGSLQALGVAKALGASVEAFVIGGAGIGAKAAAGLAGYGIASLSAIEHADLDSYKPTRWMRALIGAIGANGALTFLMSHSAMAIDLAPRLAQTLNAAYLPDVTGRDGKYWVRPVYAGKALETIELLGDVQVLTLRPNAFPLPSADGSAAPSVTVVAPIADALGDLGISIKESVARAKGAGDVELTEAEIIVTGGMGLGTPEGFGPLKDLCKVLGAALGSSRAAVHAGWIGEHHQVGQTGKTVSPKLYIACGVSGAIQHQAGMRTSKCIVAINSAADAPIFKIAHYGIVGDVKQVVPELTRAFKAALGNG